jgi:hypothetical protein
MARLSQSRGLVVDSGALKPRSVIHVDNPTVHSNEPQTVTPKASIPFRLQLQLQLKTFDLGGIVFSSITSLL